MANAVSILWPLQEDNLAPPGSLSHPFEEARHMHNGASHSPAPDFLYAVVRFDAHDVKAAVERL